MWKYAGCLLLGLTSAVAAQEQLPAVPENVVVMDSAAVAARHQGEAAYDAQQEPSYRTREPVRSAGTSKELTTGKGSELTPDKATRGNGDW